MKKIIGLIAVMVLVLTGCGSSGSKDNTLVVGMECDYAPYNFTTTEENKSEYAVKIEGTTNAWCDGYDVRVASEIAKDQGKELKIKKVAWDGLIPALNSGDIDLIIAGMSPTPERKQTIMFSDAYYQDSPVQSVIVKSDSKYANATSLADFNGATMAAQLGTFQVGLIKQIEGVNQATSLDSYGALMQALQSGTIDGYVVEQAVGKQQISETPGLTLVTFDEGKGFYMDPEYTSVAVGIKKGNTELQTAVNASLAKISPETRAAWMKEASTSTQKAQ